MRETVVVIKVKVGNMYFLRFCTGELTGKTNGNLEDFRRAERYYSVYHNETDFEAIERVMTCERIAHNVTDIEEMNKTSQSKDYRVTYNKAA